LPFNWDIGILAINKVLEINLRIQELHLDSVNEVS